MIDLLHAGLPPIQMLQSLREADPEMWGLHIEPRLDDLQATTPQPIGALTRHTSGNDPDELIQHRFLCRGAACMLVGPTGVGKSSLAMQMAMSWAVGKPAFDLKPAKCLKILLVQAENDEGDLAEMRDGVLQGMALPQALALMALGNVHTLHEDSATRDALVKRLSPVLRDGEYDLLILDPLLAYLGGDASEQRDVSGFLRNQLNPMLHRYKIGLVLVHHVNKPPSQSAQKADWSAGDFAYLGAGSAEFANWARAILAIRSIGQADIFEFLACKRGRRLPWKDATGAPTTTKHIAYHRDPDVIHWRVPSGTELSAILPDGGKQQVMQDIVNRLAATNNVAPRKEVIAQLMEDCGCGKTKADGYLSDAVHDGIVTVSPGSVHNAKTIHATGKLPAHYSDAPDGGKQ